MVTIAPFIAFSTSIPFSILIGKTKTWRAIQYGDHLTGDGPTVIDHVCFLGLEGIVPKQVDSFYRSGPSKMWLKSKNPESEAERRERARRSGATRPAR